MTSKRKNRTETETIGLEEVEDSGIGIPKGCETRIFEMFQRLSGRYEGTGIGLAIVQKSIKRIGGAWGVKSEVGKGSRFWLDLPKAG